MADSERMDIGQTSEQLIHVQLDLEHGHCLLDLGVVARCTIDRLWDIFEHEIEENFILLQDRPIRSQYHGQEENADRGYQLWLSKFGRVLVPCLRWNKRRPSNPQCWDGRRAS